MLRTSILTATLLILGGCGHEGYSPSKEYASADFDAPAASRTDLYDSSGSLQERAPTLGPLSAAESFDVQTGTPNAQLPETTNESTPPATPVQRKIIYNGSISLVVTKLDTTRQELKKLVADAGGHIQQFTEQKISGDQLSGHWVVRIPADKFDGFLADLENLGMPESQHIETSEVTAEFYDLEARLKTLRQVEQEMLQIMEKHAEKVADLLEAQRQLGQVRMDIERLEGRLRQLSDLVALSTVTIDAREDDSYIPPQSPSFGERIANGFGVSIEAMGDTGQALVLLIVVAAPWLLAIAVLIVLPLWILISLVRRRAARPA